MAKSPNEFYETPKHYVDILFDDIGHYAAQWAFEPCVGDGAIIKFAPPEIKWQTNDIDLNLAADFHMDAAKPNLWKSVPKKDWVITNPPFSLALPILDFAIKHCQNVAMLLRVSFFEPTIKREWWLRANPPDRIIYLPRYSFTGNGKSDSTTVLWGIWSHGAYHGIRIAPRFPKE